MKKPLLTLSLICATAFGFAQQVNNPGFENWSGGNPSNWGSFDAMLTGLGVTGTTLESQATPANSGSFAVELKTQSIAALGGQVLPGVVNTGAITYSGAIDFGLAPYTGGNPSDYTFYFKFTPVNGDTAFSQAIFTMWNGTSRDTIGYGGAYITAAAASYTQGTIPINWLMGGVPDSIGLVFGSSAGAAPQANTSFIVDDVMMNFATGISEPVVFGGFNAYPNPAVNELNIVAKDAKAITVNVYDLTGRMIQTAAIVDGKAKINTTEFESGFYIYSIVDENNAELKKAKFNVSK